MKKKFNYIITLFVVIILFITPLSGCSKDSKSTESTSISEENSEDKKLCISTSKNGYPLTITDCLGKETILDKKPEKVAVLSGTPLNIWYDLGGKSICTSDISNNVKLIDEYKDEIIKLPSVGAVYSINMESVIDEKPDFIIAQKGTQNSQAEKLKNMGYKVITTEIKSFDDVIASYNAFGDILDKKDLANEKIENLKSKKKEFEEKKPNEGKSVAILYVTSKSLSVKLDNSIAGDVAKILGLKNIASDLPPDSIGSESAPLDIEYIVKENPDYILVTSMISDNETAKATMEENFEKNAAWKSVKAVAENRVIYLPQEYFLYNAGPYYNESIEYMARSVYPDIYGKVEECYGK